MKQLKTPEEIYQECELKIGVPLNHSHIHSLIIAAQRDALECSIDRIDSELAESHDDYATQLLLSAKDEIVIILPKI